MVRQTVPPFSALPPPYPHSPFVHGARGKAQPASLGVSAALEHHFLFHDESLVRQGIGPLPEKALDIDLDASARGFFFLFSSLGEQSSLPASSSGTCWTLQKRNVTQGWKKKKREKKKTFNFLLIQVSRQGLGFFNSPSKNEDRTGDLCSERS